MPLAALVVFQVTFAWDPAPLVSRAPSTERSIVAVVALPTAVTEMVPDTVAPAAGAVMVTVGPVAPPPDVTRLI